MTDWFPMTTLAHALYQFECLLWSHLLCDTTPHLGKDCLSQEESSAVRCKSSLDTKQCMSRVGASILLIWVVHIYVCGI